MQGQAPPEARQIRGRARAADLETGRLEADRKEPVFVYSGFRASSTWLWSKFRAHDSLLCYYEPFNEQLKHLTLDNIGKARPDNWRSHHPGVAPYVLEYAGMLGDGVGVPGFPAARDLGDRYIGMSGLEGPLDEDVESYVRGLINHAYERYRVPLLACTRLLGRVHGLKAAFGGYHILLIRNLFHQWNSYAGQARFGNWYFFQTLYETLGLARRDSVIAHLAKFFPEETCSSLENWVAPSNFDRLFCYFVGFHLYFLTVARRSVDLVVNANALVGPDTSYRQEIIATIGGDIGIELDLGDVGERVDFPLYLIADRESCIILIGEITAAIKSSCGANADEEAFIDGLVTDLWSEEATFRRHTAGALEYVAQVEAKLADSQQNMDRQAQKADDEREALNAAWREMAQIQAGRDSEVADLQVRLDEREATIATLQADLAHEREAKTQQSDEAVKEMGRSAEELAAANRNLADARTALMHAHEALMSARGELEVERARSTRQEAEVVAALAQVGLLQAALAEVRVDKAGLLDRLVQLERGIANVDTANIDLVNRLLEAERVGKKLERCLADEKDERERLREKADRILDDPGAQQRLRAVLDLMAAHRMGWALLPETLWYAKARESLAAMPGFEKAFEEPDCHQDLDGLARAIWIALLQGP